MTFERIAGEQVWAGRIFSVHVERFRHDDGRVSRREIVRHPGAVAVLPHDDRQLYLVRQPREAVDESALLEVVAGRLGAGEPPLEAARRELAEEIGKGALHWRHLVTFYSVAGFSDERVHLYVATGLFDHRAATHEHERIEVCAFALDRLQDAIADCRDGKTLVALLLLDQLRASRVDG